MRAEPTPADYAIGEAVALTLAAVAGFALGYLVGRWTR